MTKTVFKPRKILWIDLEMTGLSPSNDLILEVAGIITDWDFKEIAVFEGVVRHDESIIRDKMSQSAAFWDDNPSVRDALLAQNSAGLSSQEIEGQLLKFINQHCAEEPKVLLAGNSIHQDRRFIETHWKLLDERLHYRMLDVSAWKVVFEGKYGKKFAKPESHRALEDIRGSIEELTYYLKKIA